MRALSDLGREGIEEDVQAQPRAVSVDAGLFECLDRQVEHPDKVALANSGRELA
ncbi:hypothetical protein [Actinacidiphila soli]|uniref:hypothetical protein n=1 Tax=Actinacidiphila soli TaxID=2487275 RepID=UPI0013E2B8B3|nr:hypothetical protein [Actinacidiphila soli]